MRAGERQGLETVRATGAAFEPAWLDVCEARGETCYVEMLDRDRRCYGRLLLPSEVLFVWNVDHWMPASESDQYARWEPVSSKQAKW